jgi:hypothetical protein
MPLKRCLRALHENQLFSSKTSCNFVLPIEREKSYADVSAMMRRELVAVKRHYRHRVPRLQGTDPRGYDPANNDGSH